jgi:hypothetical protein
VAVLIGVASAQAAITTTITTMPPDPNLLPGLTAYKITLSTGTAETIYNIKNLTITGVHQAHMGTPPAGQTPWEESWALQPPALQPAQLANDSYLLLEPDSPLGNDTLPDIGGAPTEANDSSNPTGGTVGFEVMAGYPPFPCTLGCGDIVQGGGIGLDQTYRQPTVDVAYVTVHQACPPPHIYAEVSYGAQLEDIVDKDIPEPATMSLLALGACLPLLRRRRRR